MTKEELEKMFLWSQHNKIAYTNRCLLSLDIDQLIKDNIFKYLSNKNLSASMNMKAFGVFTIDSDISIDYLFLDNNKILVYNPPYLPEWIAVKDIYLSEFALTSFREKTFLSKTFFEDLLDFRLNTKYQDVRSLYYQKYQKKKQINDIVMKYNYFNGKEISTVIFHIQDLENTSFIGQAITVWQDSGNMMFSYHKECKIEKKLTDDFCLVNRPEIQTIFKDLSPSKLKELNSIPGKISCAKCHGKLKHIEGFMNNYSYCPECE